jgi:hypothetical protein
MIRTFIRKLRPDPAATPTIFDDHELYKPRLRRG